ncbi:MAG: cupin domain-containing protein [Defluviitaleaceae bacterium]|nr:cupin domain-containing protein [Defluviitaleaceae bacterium]
MPLHIHESDAVTTKFEHHEFTPLLDSGMGCLNGCTGGVLSYTQEEYIQGGIHEDQEAFYVLEGTGRAKVGGEEFDIRPGSCFFIPPGVYHYIKKDPSVPRIKLFFFHAAI